MQINTSGQKIGAQMVSATDGSAFTGSVTCYVTIDAGTQAAGSVGSGTCTHEGNGYHTYAPSQSEVNGKLIAFTFVGTGAVPTTVQVFTRGFDESSAVVPANVTQFGGTNGTFASGRPEVNTTHVGGISQTARDIGASVLLSSGTGTGQVSLSSGKVLLQATQTGVTIPTVTTLTNAPSDSSGVTTLLSRIPSGLFTGITSLAQWLGLLAGKQTGNSAARTEIRATGAGSGTFDETTDSQEAIRDRGDAAWSTATGFSTLDEAGVRTAVGLSSANLDDQLDALVPLTVTTGAVATGTNSATTFTTTLTETADDHWNDAFLVFTSGDLAGQVKRITDYDGTGKAITVSGGFTGTPADADTFAIVNR
ncbi:MAG TPA: hypothetical protein VG538_06265 [Vicinamibacterales bacterium]|nr:hypothetical protein [Vicinamibacterales bacterium]